jgi:hypothetical protein
MQICLQHVFLKSASFCAETICFEAANFALDMIEKHRCMFDMSTVVQIAMSISLRAGFANAEAFVWRLVRKTLPNLPENERSFIARHMVFALSERAAVFEESLQKCEPFFEAGLQIDWERSSSQEFHLYNTITGKRKYYEAAEGYGFAKKGLVALLSMQPELSPEHSQSQRFEYKRQRDGAIIEVVKANDGEPLVVRMKTQVTVPFREGAPYRLDNMDTNELQAKRSMDALRVLGRDPHPQCARCLPHPYLCQMLHLPPEEPYSVQSRVGKKDKPLTDWLDWNEYGTEPIRVKSVRSGFFLEWNRANPENVIHVGDRIWKVNQARDKETILEEIEHAHTWTKYDLKFTLMRKVKTQALGIQENARLSNAEDTEKLFSKEKDSLAERLNLSQLEAVRAASTQRLSLIQGPPGTGKTTTAVELLVFLLDHQIVPTPILVSGHTNAAVDNILMGLAKRGRGVVRVGGEGSKIRAECMPYLLGEELAAEPRVAEVICATCSGSGSAFFHKEGIKCHTVLIDEGSQATESSCLIPLCHAAQHLILVGDQCQLEPFVRSEHAKGEDLGISLFNRFCQQGVVPTMLDTQYRMHPGICEFPSEAFYNGQLLSGVAPTKRVPTPSWQWPSSRIPVCFVDAVGGTESASDGKVEKKNEHEVMLVLSALRQLMHDPILRQIGEDGTYPVGIVTPYAAQKESIMKELENDGLTDASGNLLVEVNSVDGFQGREKEIIIFSAVRANDEGSVGFLHDWRRINVMLTRAKSGLIVFGHRQTLAHDFYWSNWLKWAAMRGCVMGESPSGNWTSRCLVEDEWVMKPRSLESSLESNGSYPGSDQSKNGRSFLLSSQSETCDSWEEIDTPGEVRGEYNIEPSHDSFGSHGLLDLVRPCKSADRCLLSEKTTTYDSWEEALTELDTSSEGPADGDLEPSEVSFCSQSESELDCAGLDEAGTSDLLGPLARQIQAAKKHDMRACSSNDLRIASVLNFGDAVCSDKSETMVEARGIEAQLLVPADVNDLGSGESDKMDAHGFRTGQLIDSFGGNALQGHDNLAVLESQDLTTEQLQPTQAPPLERCVTADPFDDFTVDMSNPQCSGEEIASSSLVLSPGVSDAGNVLEDLNNRHWFGIAPAPTTNVTPHPMVWMPVLVPISDAYNYSMPTFAAPASSVSEPSAEDFFSGRQFPHRSEMSIPQEVLPTIKASFDATRGVYQATWHVDARKLQSKDHIVVSPAFEMCFCKKQAPASFKLMLTSRGTNGFAKSKGMGLVKAKCESDVRGVEAAFAFIIRMGSDTFEPSVHDFSLHPVATLQERALNFHRAVDPVSNTVPIHLEATPACKPSAEEEACVVGEASAACIDASRDCSVQVLQQSSSPRVGHGSGIRRRSEVGKQRQWDRWQLRRAEQAKRKDFSD